MDTRDTWDPLDRVQAYQLALAAVREGREDARTLAGKAECRDVAPQLLRALGSIAANVAEGYSRGTAADRRRFLEYALGSTRESIVWYETSGHEAASPRVERLVMIRRLLLTMIRNSRAQSGTARESMR